MDLPAKKWQTGETPGRKIPKLPAFYPLKWEWNLNHNIWLSRSCTISCHPPENPCQLSGKMTVVPFFGHFKSEAKLLSIFWGHPKKYPLCTCHIFTAVFFFFFGGGKLFHGKSSDKPSFWDVTLQSLQSTTASWASLALGRTSLCQKSLHHACEVGR